MNIATGGVTFRTETKFSADGNSAIGVDVHCHLINKSVTALWPSDWKKTIEDTGRIHAEAALAFYGDLFPEWPKPKNALLSTVMDGRGGYVVTLGAVRE